MSIRESLAQVKDMLLAHTNVLRKTVHRARSLRSSRFGPEKAMSIFGDGMMVSADASSNIDFQLQQSAAYRSAGTASTEDLWRRNEELEDANGELRK